MYAFVQRQIKLKGKFCWTQLKERKKQRNKETKKESQKKERKKQTNKEKEKERNTDFQYSIKIGKSIRRRSKCHKKQNEIK